MRVLYINHVGILAGSSRSLLEVLSQLSSKKVCKYVISPEGEFSNKILKKKIPFIKVFGIPQFCNTEYGYYRKTRWLILLRELLFFLLCIFTYWKAKRHWGNFDIIHLNEITLLPNIFILKLFFKNAKYICNVRSIQRLENNRLTKFLNFLYGKSFDLTLAIDKNVYDSLPHELNRKILHNCLNPKVVKKKNKLSNIFTVGMVGLLNKSKGCTTFLNAAKLAKSQKLNIKFLMFGDIKNSNFGLQLLKKVFHLNENNAEEIKKQIKQLKLGKLVEILPFNDDLNEIYNCIDVLCFPSLLMSPGRPLFEAGFYKVPSIVAIKKPHRDTFQNKITGLLVKPTSSNDLLDKILILRNQKRLRKLLGENAYKLSHKNFNAEINAKKLLNIYKNILKNAK